MKQLLIKFIYMRLNLTHYSIMKIPNKRELQQISFNHSSDITFQDFTNLCKKYIASDKSLHVSFRKNIKVDKDNWW